MRKFFKLILVAVLLLVAVSVRGCKSADKRTEINLDLTYDKHSGIINGKAVYKLINSSNRILNEVLFNLPANAYDGKNKAIDNGLKNKAYYAGESVGGTEILSCSSSGSPLPFSLSEDKLLLTVSAGEIPKGGEREIEIEFKTTPPHAALRLGITENAVNLADFYPMPCKLSENGFVPAPYHPFGDPYFADAADFSVKIAVPSEYTVACSGSPEKTSVDGETTEYSYSLSGGRNFACVLSDRFNVYAVKTKNADIFYYTPSQKDEQTEKRLAEIEKRFEYFNSAFGNYPHKTFSIVETDYAASGADFSGLCVVSLNGSDDEKTYAASHGIAHEWWGEAVGIDRVNEAYLAEGLADYSVCLYLENSGLKGDAKAMIDNRKSAYKSFFDINSVLGGTKNTAMKRPLSSFETKDEYVAIAYDKSFLMFSELEKTVGENHVKSAMRKLFSANKFAVAGENELVKAFGYKDYFESFISGKVIV